MCSDWHDSTCSFLFLFCLWFWVLNRLLAESLYFLYSVVTKLYLTLKRVEKKNVSLWEIVALWSTNERFHDLWSQGGQIWLRNPTARMFHAPHHFFLNRTSLLLAQKRKSWERLRLCIVHFGVQKSEFPQSSSQQKLEEWAAVVLLGPKFLNRGLLRSPEDRAMSGDNLACHRGSTLIFSGGGGGGGGQGY